MEWLRKEYLAIKNSKTIRLSYLKTLAGLVSVALALSGNFESVIDPFWFGLGVAVLGMMDNKLRKVTTQPLDDK